MKQRNLRKRKDRWWSLRGSSSPLQCSDPVRVKAN